MSTSKIRFGLLPLSILVAFSVSAQTKPDSAQPNEGQRLKALEQKLGQSQALIEQLQKRLSALEQNHPQDSQQSTSPAAAGTGNGGDVSNRVESLEKTVSGIVSNTVNAHPDSGVPLHGFIDVGYATSGGTPPAYDKSGSRSGTFDVYLTPEISARVKGLVELAFEYDRDGVLGTDLERLQLGYVVNNNLTLWGGRFHTPYGYWNTAFHHGAQIQTSITRPRMIAFEDQGGILPSHTVGAWATGKTDTGLGRLSYDAFIGNSDSLRDGTLDYNAAGYNTGTPSFGFNLGIQPHALSGLTLGLHGLREKINSYDALNLANGQVTLQMLGGYGFYENDRWEVIGEYYGFKNSDLMGTAGTNNSWAAFLQGGYQFVDRWTGFIRYEKTDLSQNDPYFHLMENGTTNFGSSYHQATLGVRYDLDARSALKLQVEQVVDQGNAGRTVNWLRTQYSVRF